MAKYRLRRNPGLDINFKTLQRLDGNAPGSEEFRPKTIDELYPSKKDLLDTGMLVDSEVVTENLTEILADNPELRLEQR